MQHRLSIQTVTVVSANGTMGTNVSAIFASFGNAKVYMVSRDIDKSKVAVIKAGKTVKADSLVTNRPGGRKPQAEASLQRILSLSQRLNICPGHEV